MRTSGASSARRGRVRTGAGRAQQQPRRTPRPCPACAITVPAAEPSRPEVQAVDEPQLEDDVDELRGDDDEQRRPQVLDPAQVALAGERDERGHEPERADAQVALGERGRLAAPPNSATSGSASATQTSASTSPIALASQSDCAASSPARAASPAPCSRATCAVVPYVRKMHSETSVVSTVAAIASAASWVVPRCPTIAVSTSRYSGSAASAPSAGIASRRISRS